MGIPVYFEPVHEHIESDEDASSEEEASSEEYASNVKDAGSNEDTSSDEELSNNLAEDVAPAALDPASNSVVAPAPAPAPVPVVAAEGQPVLPGYGAYPIDSIPEPVLPPAEPKTKSRRTVKNDRRCGNCHMQDRQRMFTGRQHHLRIRCVRGLQPMLL